MKKKISSGFLALVFLLQAFLPSFAYANQAKLQDTKVISRDFRGSDNVVTIGKLKGVGFSKDNPTASISIEEVKEKNHKNTAALDGLEISDETKPQALKSSGSPYIRGQQPADPDKPKYWANVQGTLTTRGIDGTTFDWEKVLGQEAKVKLLFTQTNGNVMTGVTYSLLVDKDGTYTWQGSDGKPTYLPIFDADGNPYTYNVQIERNYSKNVQLIIQESNGTPSATWKPEGDKQVATIQFLNIGIQQVASTKFVSEWHTGVNETDRPQIEGYFKANDETDNDFNFPKNDTTRTILRYSFVENFVEDEDNGPWSFLSSELETTPKTVEVKTDTQGLTFEENNGVKTVKSGDHKFKYDFTYDVINGGKLTMTEIIPVTFDANSGKFKNFTAPDTETNIVKEVEYDGTLTDKAENPTKDRETFKGWSETKGGTTPVTADAFKNITKAKTLYAIWDNNDIVAEQLEVKESFKDGDTWVNDFIPDLATLKGQVKIKDANGDPQALTNDDTFEILDDSDTAITGDALKDYLYEKLKEKDNPNGEPTRVETVKAKVTVNGTSKIVEIPIKVIKNIYEAKTEEGKPNYVPEGYVKVTVDPTTKAKEPQKYFYYVNPKASVVIPGKDPTGTGDNQFTKWLIKGTAEEYKLADKPRHQFSGETTIEAQYVSNVIPGNPDGSKPNTVPENYVKVSFTLLSAIGGKIADDATTVYYVNPDKEVTIPQPKTIADIGYEFDKWDPDTTTAKKYANNTTVIGSFRGLDNIIPATNDDGTSNNKPDGYVTVTFTDGMQGKVHGKITSGKTVYYVNPKAKKQLKNLVLESQNLANRPIVTPDVGYEFTGWLQGKEYYIVKDVTVPAEYKPIADVIPKTKDDESEKPKGYVTVKLIPTDKATDETKTETIYYVNPTKEVTLPSKDPVGKEITDKNENTYTYMFKNWTVTKGTNHSSWDKPETGDTEIKGTFTEETEITAKYNIKAETLVNGPKAKENPITPINKLPDPKDLIKNPYDPANPDNKDNLPDGTSFTYTPDGTPDVSQPGKTTAKVEVRYPNGKTMVVEIPLTVVDDVIPKDENTKKPDGYVTLTFDKGDHGKEITGQTVYYVNPKADPAKTLGDASIVKPEVKAETGYKFTGWDTEDGFAIKADKTVKAQYAPIADVIPKDNPQGGENEKPDGYITVTFVKGDHGELEGNTIFYINPNKAVVLEGKAPTVKPNTGYTSAGWDTSINQAIQYKDGAKIKALYNEKGDVIPQENPDGSDKPAGYLTVTFDKGAHGELSGKTVYYVNPNKEVTVPAPTVIPATDYVFDKWDQSLTQKFTAENTTITAEYKVIPYDPSVDAEYVLTEIGKQPTVVDYAKAIHVSGGTGTVLRIVEQPDVSSKGMKTAKVEVEITSGSKTTRKIVEVPVFVKPDPEIIEKPYPVPGDCNNSCEQPNQPNKPNQPNIGMDALNTTDHYQYLIGYPDGNFAPNRGMTRAEVATMFTRLLRERPVKGQRYYTGFSDIQAGDWYANTVGYAVQVGIVSGYPDGSFKPNKPITRAEFASIASRFDALAQGNNIAFNDLAPSHWGYNAIRSAASKGWISGYPDNTFRPEKAISRAEVTSITNRMLNRYADLYWIDAHRAEVIRFGDVKRSDWYFEPIMEATMGHDFIRDRDGKTEHWSGLNGRSFIEAR